MRRLAGSLIVLLVVIGIPAMLIMAQGTNQIIVTATPDGSNAQAQLFPATPTMDPVLLTATDSVQQATNTVAARMTETACILDQCDMTPTPPPYIVDSLDMTATFIIGNATQAASGEMTATACALGLCSPTPNLDLDPLDITATYVVGQATEAVLRLSATPTPDIAALHERYIDVLESKLGFRIPLFDTLVDNFLANIPAGVRDSIVKFDPEVAITWFAGREYIATIIPKAGDRLLGGDILLLFQIINNNPILISNPIPSLPLNSEDLFLSFDTGGFGVWDSQRQFWRASDTQASIIGFADRNKNGLPDLAILDGGGGNCCLPSIKIIEIQESGNIAEITPRAPNIYPAFFIDPDHDGRWEIIGISPTCCAQNARIIRWLAWDGNRYADVSAEHADFYMPLIEGFINSLDSDKEGCYPLDFAHMIPLEHVMANYYAMGKLREGWATILPRLRWDECSPAELRKYGDNITGFRWWLQNPY